VILTLSVVEREVAHLRTAQSKDLRLSLPLLSLQLQLQLPLPLSSLYLTKNHVISTEATDSLIVCCAAERPPHFAFAVAFAVAVAVFVIPQRSGAICYCFCSCRHPERSEGSLYSAFAFVLRNGRALAVPQQPIVNVTRS
jgi:hypothetical protein